MINRSCLNIKYHRDAARVDDIPLWYIVSCKLGSQRQRNIIIVWESSEPLPHNRFLAPIHLIPQWPSECWSLKKCPFVYGPRINILRLKHQRPQTPPKKPSIIFSTRKLPMCIVAYVEEPDRCSLCSSVRDQKGNTRFTYLRSLFIRGPSTVQDIRMKLGAYPYQTLNFYNVLNGKKLGLET